MALSKRSFANLEAIKDDDTRDAIRILFDRIHDLQEKLATASTTEASPAKNLADPVDPGDAVSLSFADNRYQPFRLTDPGLETSAVNKLVGLGLTEAEARSLL
jgi:transcription elongation GreA/GreB family factor